MDNLKSCPFCGAAPEWNWGQTGDGSPWRYLACSECQAMGPHVAEWELSKTAPDKDAVNDAIRSEAWNRRAALEGDALPVAVKALEWQDLGNGFSRAPAPLFGSIRVEHYGDDFTVCYSVPGFSDTFTEGSFATLDAAKAAAQADYESRIRSALVAPSSDSLRKLEVAREALRNVLPTLEELAEKRGLSFSEAGGLADDVRAALSQLEKPQDAGEKSDV